MAALALSSLPGSTYGAPAHVGAANSTGVQWIDITRDEPFADGASFGDTGAYEKLVGTAHLAVDPTDPHNALITDLDKAPRDASGLVEYSTDLYILKPADMQRGNGKILFNVVNRGSKGSLTSLDDAPGAGSNDPTTLADAGNGLLFRQGYTLVWAGWQADVLPGGNRMTIQLPIATNAGAEIDGPLTVRFDVAYGIPMQGAVSLPLGGSPSADSYETASLDSTSAVLTLRDALNSPPTTIPSDRWAFATCDGGAQHGEVQNVVPDRKHICLFDGFDPNQLYQLAYTARNPRPTGLGFAATRDVISFLRSSAVDGSGKPSPLGTSVSHVYCYGVSQDGRYLRSSVYLGFNEDLQGHRVCDGVITQIAGAQGLALNTRFASPNTATQWAAVGLYPGDLFPFTYGMTTDPLTGRTDAILKRPSSDPVVIQLDGENEWYQSYASLVTHDAFGTPLQLPNTVRYYYLSSAQHASGAPSTAAFCAEPTNPLNYNAFIRMALVSLDQWVSTGVEPPPSQYPRADDATAQAPQIVHNEYPAVPGFVIGSPLILPVRDYGAGFDRTGGIVTNSPSIDSPDKRYAVLVPQVDADGNDVAGLRSPDIQVPLGTYAGWNTRAQGYRAGDLCGLNGTYIPFALTPDQAEASGDSRLTIQERYVNQADYVSKVKAATRDLVARGYLLDEDAQNFEAAAAQRDIFAAVRASSPRADTAANGRLP